MFDWQGVPNHKDYERVCDQKCVPDPNDDKGVIDQKGPRAMDRVTCLHYTLLNQRINEACKISEMRATVTAR